MLYDGEPVELTAEQEEVANMFGIMKETDYMKKQIFLDNFWNDWRKVLCSTMILCSLYTSCAPPAQPLSTVQRLSHCCIQ